MASHLPARRPSESDHGPGEYAALVERARAAFMRGDLFEVVPGQLFADLCADPPSVVFHRLRQANPAPYGALINLGEGEFLVAASPEMYVRVEGKRIETCPISGTIARGRDPVEDAERIRELLNSAKDESELTMCTDVDRNDKSRVCVPGTVRVIGRRQIELYSRLIHTVDHVDGVLREEFDALDGFLSHAWAVTVTGAPKRWAIRFIEQEERSSRRWYGGAIGRVTFDGNMNTGLTLRTIRMKDGVAEVRAGATLLYDSDPQAEEAETRLKAAAMFTAIRGTTSVPASRAVAAAEIGKGRRVLLIDHEDFFVHTLANYIRTTGAEVVTMRPDLARAELREGGGHDLVVLSPGPGRPADFAMAETLDLILRRQLPVFGVCLGLQGIVEYFGGSLAVLDPPMHGKPSPVRVRGGRLLCGLPSDFVVGRYHSLHAVRSTLPPELSVTAETEDGVVMALEHQRLPIAAVQFHPESVMTLRTKSACRSSPPSWRLCPTLTLPAYGGKGRGGARRDTPAATRRGALRFDVQRIDRLARRHEEAVASAAAETQIGAALGQHDAADHFAVGRKHDDAIFCLAAGPSAPQIAVHVDPDAVGAARLGGAELASVGGRSAVFDDVVDLHRALPGARRVDDVEQLLVGREGQPVGPLHVADRNRHLSRGRVEPIDAVRQFRGSVWPR